MSVHHPVVVVVAEIAKPQLSEAAEVRDAAEQAADEYREALAKISSELTKETTT